MRKPKSEEGKRNIQLSRLNIDWDKAKKNMSIAQKKYFSNNDSKRKGVKFTNEHKLNISKGKKLKLEGVLGNNSNAKKVLYNAIEYSCKKELYLELFTNICSYSNFNVRIKDGRINVKELI